MRKVLGPGQPNGGPEVQWVVTKLGLLSIVGLIAFLLMTGSACDKPTRTARRAAGEATLKVMSFNVNFGGPDTTSIAAIANADADLVLLQETTSDWEQEIRKNLSKRYPHMAFRHCCGAGGLAILSKDMIDKGSYFKAKEVAGSWFPAWRHVVQTPLGRVQVLNLHLRPQISRGGSVIRGYFTTPTLANRKCNLCFESPSLELIRSERFEPHELDASFDHVETRENVFAFNPVLRFLHEHKERLEYVVLNELACELVALGRTGFRDVIVA